jgi:hypothetical protein
LALRVARVIAASHRDMAELLHAEGLLDSAARYVVLAPDMYAGVAMDVHRP